MVELSDRTTSSGSPAHPAPVTVERGPVTLPTLLPDAPDRYPAYLRNRVYQGSSGRVYPLPFHERITSEVRDVAWDRVALANEHVSIEILPQLGGRIHAITDLARGTDMIYRNSIIKPALVGLAGPWISGGIEFNWPQHHRPATFLPTSCSIEHEDDGAVTVWCSDHDPFDRMKGMHGIRLRPGSALIEARVRLLNRTDDVRTFLWWANVAARVHDDYQAFFPTDVHYVADHAKRAITAFPAADRPYYGWDYPEQARLAERGEDEPAADRLDFYRNVAVPTSYMCIGSTQDHFGGYDHRTGSGFVHVADHRISPGKKMWTWGNAPFGWAWDANLTETDGPYVELMAGVYTDNQPDFSFLAPGETKTFSQFWFPIQDIGPAHAATPEAACRLDLLADGGSAQVRAVGAPAEPLVTRARVAVATTRTRPGARVLLLDAEGAELWSTVADLAPGQPLVVQAELGRAVPPAGISLRVHAASEGPGASAASDAADGTAGELLVELEVAEPEAARQAPEPEIATEPPAPEDVASTDELYLTGRHLEQYRHATRRPQPYWREALRRDPGDARCALALGTGALRRGDLTEAEELVGTALARLTLRNPNPESGQAHYRLAQIRERRGRLAEALDLYGKAAWDEAWAPAAELAAARIRARHRSPDQDRAALALVAGAGSLRQPRPQHRCTEAVLLRRLGRPEDACRVLDSLLREDPLDMWARHLAGRELDTDGPTLLDVALEQVSVGEGEDALSLLERATAAPVALGQVAIAPLAHLHRAAVLADQGHESQAREALAEAERADATWCWASRPADLDMLESVTARWPEAVLPHRLLCHLLIHLGRPAEAARHGQRAIALRDDDPVVRRNLAVIAVNEADDPATAQEHYRRARELAPGDARLLYEQDQLRRREARDPQERLRALQDSAELVAARDDLTLELVGLLIACGRAQEALDILEHRPFQPWEGGEGMVLQAWEEAHLALSREALSSGDAQGAARHARAALEPITSLGEARHPLANTAHLDLALGDALAAQGRTEQAREHWQRAAASVGDFRGMESVPVSDLTAHAVRACRRLGDTARARELTSMLTAHAAHLEQTPARVDYFATSLPAMLLFTPDLAAQQRSDARLLAAQAAELNGDLEAARTLLAEVLAHEPTRMRARELATQLAGESTEDRPCPAEDRPF